MKAKIRAIREQEIRRMFQGLEKYYSYTEDILLKDTERAIQKYKKEILQNPKAVFSEIMSKEDYEDLKDTLFVCATRCIVSAIVEEKQLTKKMFHSYDEDAIEVFDGILFDENHVYFPNRIANNLNSIEVSNLPLLVADIMDFIYIASIYSFLVVVRQRTKAKYVEKIMSNKNAICLLNEIDFAECRNKDLFIPYEEGEFEKDI